jgi:hypothetical protein
LAAALGALTACNGNDDSSQSPTTEETSTITPPRPSCFARGTPVATPRGPVSIEELQIGDHVLAYDEREHRVVVAPVRSVARHPKRIAGALRASNGETLWVTPEHPIYLPAEDRYVPAGTLETGSRLLALTGAQETTSVIGLRYRAPEPTRPVTVYDLTVARFHNYFAGGLLVHNKPPCQSQCQCGGPCPELDARCLTVAVRLALGSTDAGSCAWDIPVVDGERAEPDRVDLEIVVGEEVVPSSNTSVEACSESGWFFDPAMATTIVACPELCARLRLEPLARVTALVGCHRPESG